MFTKIPLTIFIFLTIFNLSDPAAYHYPSNRDHPGRCWDKYEEYLIGAHQVEGACGQFECGDDFHGILKICDAVIKNGEYIEPDVTKKYPDCCVEID